MQIVGWQWLAASTVALAAHAAVGLALLDRPSSLGASGGGAALQAISISPRGGMSQIAEAVRPSQAEASPIANGVRQPPPVSRPVAAKMVATPAADAPAVERSRARPSIKGQVPAAEPLTAQASASPAVEVRSDPEGPPEPRRRPQRPPQRGVMTADATAEQGGEVVARSARDNAAAPAQGAASGPGVGRGDDRPGSAVPAQASANPGAQAAYVAELLAWMKRHQIYPESALSRRQQGTTVVYFQIDREGRLLDSRLERSSGFRLLDREAMAMLQRASPMPRLPAAIAGPTFSAQFPIEFELR